EPLTWIPVYLLLLFLLKQRFGWNGLAWSVPVIALMVLCSDSGSVVLFKNTVQRLRPSHVEALNGSIHLLTDDKGEILRGGSFGFVSSHASNHFAIAVFMIGVLHASVRGLAPVLIGWAVVIGYSRIYLGMHYPGDVLVGALYGALIGWSFALLHTGVMMRIQRLG
ncbi:MAG: phosphatase PAP2 family protein, partial [Flavobacteriales bacterium]|nr:phosphatase PAP2 family protein [Flavobacteriales bacterium]